MIKGREDASNDNVHGHYIVRRELINLMLDAIGNLAGQCTSCRAS
jgi:hypothetical protein